MVKTRFRLANSRSIHDLLPKLTKKEGMEVIVPEEKDKIHLLESESIEKEENETRDTLREELLELSLIHI